VLARAKRLLNDYTLVHNLDRQFGDLPVGLRKILLSMIHGSARTPARFDRVNRDPNGGLAVWFAHM
jgi:hypothetical protein